MAGSLLGPDQIRKINAAFPALVSHLRSLLAADHTGVGLMRVHVQVETFDSDEMAKIFRELSFISPHEKRALVRAAIYELMATDAELFVSPNITTAPPFTTADIKPLGVPDAPQRVFSPPQFNLNINKTEAFHGEPPADTPAPAPVVTSTHTASVPARLKEGQKEAAAQTEKLNAAVAKLRANSAPKPIEIMDVPADASLQADAPKE